MYNREKNNFLSVNQSSVCMCLVLLIIKTGTFQCIISHAFCNVICKYSQYKLFIDITLIKVYILNILYIICCRNTVLAPCWSKRFVFCCYFFFILLGPVENIVLHHNHGLVHVNHIVDLYDSSGFSVPNCPMESAINAAGQMKTPQALRCQMWLSFFSL